MTTEERDQSTICKPVCLSLPDDLVAEIDKLRVNPEGKIEVSRSEIIKRIVKLGTIKSPSMMSGCLLLI